MVLENGEAIFYASSGTPRFSGTKCKEFKAGEKCHLCRSGEWHGVWCPLLHPTRGRPGFRSSDPLLLDSEAVKPQKKLQRYRTKCQCSERGGPRPTFIFQVLLKMPELGSRLASGEGPQHGTRRCIFSSEGCKTPPFPMPVAGSHGEALYHQHCMGVHAARWFPSRSEELRAGKSWSTGAGDSTEGTNS